MQSPFSHLLRPQEGVEAWLTLGEGFYHVVQEQFLCHFAY